MGFTLILSEMFIDNLPSSIGDKLNIRTDYDKYKLKFFLKFL